MIDGCSGRHWREVTLNLFCDIIRHGYIPFWYEWNLDEWKSLDERDHFILINNIPLKCIKEHWRLFSHPLRRVCSWKKCMDAKKMHFSVWVRIWDLVALSLGIRRLDFLGWDEFCGQPFVLRNTKGKRFLHFTSCARVIVDLVLVRRCLFWRVWCLWYERLNNMRFTTRWTRPIWICKNIK